MKLIRLEFLQERITDYWHKFTNPNCGVCRNIKQFFSLLNKHRKEFWNEYKAKANVCHYVEYMNTLGTAEDYSDYVESTKWWNIGMQTDIRTDFNQSE